MEDLNEFRIKLWEKQHGLPKTDKEVAYALGAIYGYLIDQSNTTDKMNLEPIVNAYSFNQIKIAVMRLFEKYSYTLKKGYISGLKDIFQAIRTEDVKGNIYDIKLYFYAGFMDKGCVFSLFGKENKEGD